MQSDVAKATRASQKWQLHSQVLLQHFGCGQAMKWGADIYLNSHSHHQSGSRRGRGRSGVGDHLGKKCEIQIPQYRGVALIRRATFSSFRTTKFLRCCFTLEFGAKICMSTSLFCEKRICVACQIVGILLKKWTCALSHTNTHEHDVAPSIHRL